MGKKVEVSRKNAEPVKSKNKGEQKEDEKTATAEVSAADTADNEGFSTWLRSNEGIDMMRLFVVANSILIFVTMAWPNMQRAFEIVKEYFFADAEEDEF